jgi:hypothetical protein
MQEIKIVLDGIGHVLADRKLAVPRYQRSYAWEDRNVLELLADIQRAKSGDEKEYFLGSIVLTGNDTSQQEVVDGQQRLATVTMILAEIRNVFQRLEDASRASDIESSYLAKRHLRSQEQLPQLSLNQHDNDYFVKRILGATSDDRTSAQATRQSHRLLAQAAQNISDYFSKAVGTLSDTTAILLDWVDYLVGNAKVIVVVVPDEANAYTIFETLNDRGLDLSISDLLKNFLFQTAGNRLEEVQASWTSMYSLFEAAGTEGEVVDYIRQLWSSQHGLTRERELYGDIKGRITGKQQSVDFTKRLESSARLYQAIVKADQEYWGQFGATTRQHMLTLNLLGITRIRPLLLAVLEVFEPREVKKTLKMMVSWAVRFMVVGGLGTGTLEEYYSQRAKEIRDGVIKDAAALRKSMETLVPSDSRFQDAFARASVSKARLARYYLQVLERQTRGESEPEFVPNENEEEINLEHVLPKTLNADWSHITPEVADVYTNRIGNLALLQKKPNVDIGNASFAGKTKVLKDSDYRLTAMTGKEKTWDKKQIEQRQQKLAELAVQAWSLKF